MRGNEEQQGNMWLSINVEKMIPAEHPIRRIKELADKILRSMDGIFAEQIPCI